MRHSFVRGWVLSFQDCYLQGTFSAVSVCFIVSLKPLVVLVLKCCKQILKTFRLN